MENLLQQALGKSAAKAGVREIPRGYYVEKEKQYGDSVNRQSQENIWERRK